MVLCPPPHPLCKGGRQGRRIHPQGQQPNQEQGEVGKVRSQTEEKGRPARTSAGRPLQRSLPPPIHLGLPAVGAPGKQKKFSWTFWQQCPIQGDVSSLLCMGVRTFRSGLSSTISLR